MSQHAAVVTTRNKSKLYFTYSNKHRTNHRIDHQYAQYDIPRRTPMHVGVVHETRTSASSRRCDAGLTSDGPKQKTHSNKKKCTSRATCILGHMQREQVHETSWRNGCTQHIPSGKSCILQKRGIRCVTDKLMLHPCTLSWAPNDGRARCTIRNPWLQIASVCTEAQTHTIITNELSINPSNAQCLPLEKGELTAAAERRAARQCSGEPPPPTHIHKTC